MTLQMGMHSKLFHAPNMDQIPTSSISRSKCLHSSSTACKTITVIFARGTDSSGNMGTSTGPPFVESIGALVGVDNIAVQGVDYPASIVGFLEGGDDDGAALMASLTAQAMTQCPDTKVVVSGYRLVIAIIFVQSFVTKAREVKADNWSTKQLLSSAPLLLLECRLVLPRSPNPSHRN